MTILRPRTDLWGAQRKCAQRGLLTAGAARRRHACLALPDRSSSAQQIERMPSSASHGQERPDRWQYERLYAVFKRYRSSRRTGGLSAEFLSTARTAVALPSISEKRIMMSVTLFGQLLSRRDQPHLLAAPSGHWAINLSASGWPPDLVPFIFVGVFYARHTVSSPTGGARIWTALEPDLAQPPRKIFCPLISIPNRRALGLPIMLVAPSIESPTMVADQRRLSRHDFRSSVVLSQDLFSIAAGDVEALAYGHGW